MFEEICTFLGIEGAGNQADSTIESFDSALGGLAQMRFQFTEALFDWIEVWRILRQVSQMSPHSFDCLSHPSDLVRRKIIHDDRIATTERRGQTLFDISDEGQPVHWSVDDEWRDHSIVAQAGYKGDGLPMSMRRVADQSNAPWTSTVEPHHLGAGRGLVDKHQSRRAKRVLLSKPASSRTSDIGTILLSCAQAFF